MARRLPILLLMACARAAPELGPVGPDPRIEAADALWENRGEGGLEPVQLALEEVYRDRPQDPEVLWRLTRLYVAIGLVEPDPRASQFALAEARAFGIACLELDPAFVQVRASPGMVDAVRLLEEDDADCGAWTALAWTRWMAVHGPAAAALDRRGLEALVDHILPLAEGEAVEAVRYADVLLRAMQPLRLGTDLAESRALIEGAIAERPDDLNRRVDLIRLVAVPMRDQALIRSTAEGILAQPADTPEDRRAHVIATEILEGTATIRETP